jgi:hypothetical protein
MAERGAVVVDADNRVLARSLKGDPAGVRLDPIIAAANALAGLDPAAIPALVEAANAVLLEPFSQWPVDRLRAALAAVRGQSQDRVNAG